MLHVVYVATGEAYYREALLSAASVRESNPGARVTIVSDREHEKAEGVRFQQLAGARFSMRDKIAGLLCLGDDAGAFVYLDSDTYVAGSLLPAVEALSRFDLGGAVCEVRVTPRGVCGDFDFDYTDVPRAFPELNTGVLAMQDSPALRDFLRQWLRIFDEENAEGRRFWVDQPSFRKALFQGGLRFFALPAEYNMRLPFCGYFESPVVVLHGRRDTAGFKKLAARINKNTGPRVYFPRLFIACQNTWLVESGMRLRNVLRDGFRALLRPFRGS